MADVGGSTGADGATSGRGWEIEERDGKKMGWKREMESLFKEVEALFDVISSDAQTADDGQ
jgi:hypothetical protein